MQKADKRKMDAFEMWCYRRILRISWTEMRSNIWVQEKIGTGLVVREAIRKQKLRFFGHVIRRDGLDKQIITGKVNGSRRRGRPPTTWIKDITVITGLSLAEAARAAQDRRAWRRIVWTTASHPATPD